ncbi:hypothetical protein PSTT_09712 [Puccinia striiformis]|uniref:Dynamin-type G domain-containing protein n=1 Tax=Puccinia striiformis TaxID=27350 RepID=A0A2S4V7I7_9BASI|nr:hypothetical protein PSTT_09712 [Puccinia striiformis]
MPPTGQPPVIGCPPSLLDKVDELRKLGLQDMVSLPQIAVVGDQSSGKSTLLEYISGVTFPKDAGMCTCFATEVSMRPAAQFSAKVFINHQPDTRLKEPRSPEEVAGVIQEAKRLFVDASGPKAIYDDILTVELNGPGLPILTLVDLPGYIHTHATGQAESIVEDIAQLVERYLDSPRTVIMAVIPVNRDFETNVAIKHIRRFDPDGKRTLCVLTKPDQVDSGTEKNVLEIVRYLKRSSRKGISRDQEGDQEDARETRPTTRFTRPVVGTDLEKFNLLQKNINRIMQEIKYLVDGHYSAGGFSRRHYIRARVQTLNRGFYEQILGLTTARVESLDVAKILQESRGRELRGMVQFEPFVILCRKVIKQWSLPTTEHITGICRLVESISCQVIEKVCEKILVDYSLERMIEFIENQQKRMHLDAAEIFDDELTPLTCQEFHFPSGASARTRSFRPTQPFLQTPASAPKHSSHRQVVAEHVSPAACFPKDPAHQFLAQSIVPNLSTEVSPAEEDVCLLAADEVLEADAEEESHVDMFEPNNHEATASDSSDSEGPVGRRSTEVDSDGDAQIRSFVRDYCRAAATRYVDSICLYVIERRLFKKCDVRVNDWFMEDKSALARVREPAQTSALRESLPAAIDRLNQALLLL